MSASIILSDLTCATPDGAPLFSNLSLSFGPRRTGLIGRNGSGKSTLLRIIAGELVPAAGRVTVNGRLAMLRQAMLRQAVQVGPEETLAGALGIAGGLDLLERIEAGPVAPEVLERADWTLPSRFAAALASVGLPPLAPSRRMAELSGGQRTRALLAALVFDEPDVILLDEPTNNLDAAGRAAVAALLRGWRGAAVVVSHDRDLLEGMDAIVELSSLGAASYGGGYGFYRRRKEIEAEAAAQRLHGAELRLARTEAKVQAAAERQARKDAAGRRGRAKGGAPKLLLDARKERAEATGGGLAHLGERQVASAAAEVAAAAAEVERLRGLSIRIAPTGLAAGQRVVEAHGLTGGPDRTRPVIRGLDLVLEGPERLAITGPNGAGKSTLLALLTGRLAPVAGEVRITPSHALLDQTMALLDPAETLRGNFRRLNPEADENACRAALARFQFRDAAALRPAGSLSGGQMLRAGLACVLGSRPPRLLLLDEPTNHLDLASVGEVEAALAGYDGAIVAVSHDPAFLKAIGITRELALPQEASASMH